MIVSRKTLLVVIAINALASLYLLFGLPSNRADFRCFYSDGQIVRQAPGRLYDLKYQVQEQQMEFNDGIYIPFYHPPHELLLYAPLSKLPYTTSLNVWRVFSLLCLALSGLILARAIGADPLHSVLLVSAIYPAAACLTTGQDSLLLLLLLSGAFYLVKNDHDTLAALVLAAALFKPQLPVVLAISLLAVGRRRFFAWFALFGSALAGASMVYVGWDGVKQLIQTQRVGEIIGIGPALMPSVRGLIAFAFHDVRWLAITLFVAAIAAMLPVWRRSRSLYFAVASSICVASAFAIYVYVYDLVVLAIPLLLVMPDLRRKDLDVAILHLATSGPLLVLAYYEHAPALLLLPTLALGFMVSKSSLNIGRILPQNYPGLLKGGMKL